MPNSEPDPRVIASSDSMQSDDPYDLVYSNITFLNALLEEHFRYDELSPDAVKSYYVDYYLAQVNNGGFSQFVYNSGWEPGTIKSIVEGMEAMGAIQHLELFAKSASIMDRIGIDGMEKFFDSDFFGDNAERDLLNSFDDQFSELSDIEDLVELNSKWLRSLPHLTVMSVDEMKSEIESRVAALPDRDEREAEALANEPRYAKLIRALCASVNQELSHITAGDPNHKHNGKPTLAWHFITDAGHHYMVDIGGRAFMYHGDSHNQLTEIEAGEKYGSE